MNTSKVPEITDPLGRHWNQPDRHKILIGEKHATMSDRSFKSLCDYSHSIPTGTYTGKMWKRRNFKNGRPIHQLVWYGEVRESDNTIAIHYREIINLKRT